MRLLTMKLKCQTIKYVYNLGAEKYEGWNMISQKDHHYSCFFLGKLFYYLEEGEHTFDDNTNSDTSNGLTEAY